MAIQEVQYYSGDIKLQWPHGMKNAEFNEKFNIKGKWYDSFHRYVGYAADGKTILPVTRIIEYKKNPSLHKCDGRCMGAKGKTCECSCGGKNHGINS